MQTESAVQPYSSLSTMRQAHRDLLANRHSRNQHVFLEEIEQFIRRGRMTGVRLETDDDRWEAQNLLDFWANELLHNERRVPQATLAEFHPTHTPPHADDT